MTVDTNRKIALSLVSVVVVLFGGTRLNAKDGSELSLELVEVSGRGRSERLLEIRNNGRLPVFFDWNSAEVGWGAKIGTSNLGNLPAAKVIRQSHGGPLCPPESAIVGVPPGGTVLMAATLKIPPRAKQAAQIVVGMFVANGSRECDRWTHTFLVTKLRSVESSPRKT